jgi:hypothetical protein
VVEKGEKVDEVKNQDLLKGIRRVDLEEGNKVYNLY